MQHQNGRDKSICSGSFGGKKILKNDTSDIWLAFLTIQCVYDFNVLLNKTLSFRNLLKRPIALEEMEKLVVLACSSGSAECLKVYYVTNASISMYSIV